MAKYTEADCRQCRRAGCKLFLKGEKCVSGKCPFDKRPTVPGQHGAARHKVSEYGLQLAEKQKVKKAYGMQERQFRIFYEKAANAKGSTGENLLRMLECRLDNVVYRMGLGSSRAESRQNVNHRHIAVNGKTVNIPSYQVKVGDVISVRENKQDLEQYKVLKGVKLVTPKWIEYDSNKLTGKIIALPLRDDIDMNIQEHLIVELYSR